MITLPPDLEQFLETQDFAMLAQSTSDGTVLVIKAPRRDIEAVRGRVPILVSYELHRHPCGPVLRLLLTVYDRPGSHLTFETFGNVGDPVQLAEWQDLLDRPDLRVLFFDEHQLHRLSKRVGQPKDASTRRLLPTALRILGVTDPAMLDFDRAKAEVMAHNPL